MTSALALADEVKICGDARLEKPADGNSWTLVLDTAGSTYETFLTKSAIASTGDSEFRIPGLIGAHLGYETLSPSVVKTADGRPQKWNYSVKPYLHNVGDYRWVVQAYWRDSDNVWRALHQVTVKCGRR